MSAYNKIPQERSDYMDWKNSFDLFSLQRGKELYENRACSTIYAQGSLYEGFVKDPVRLNNYFIQAEIKDGFVKSISCSCSKARKGKLCEHEAAFLFKIEEKEFNGDVQEDPFAQSIPSSRNPFPPVQGQKTMEPNENRDSIFKDLKEIYQQLKNSDPLQNESELERSLESILQRMRENLPPSNDYLLNDEKTISKKNQETDKLKKNDASLLSPQDPIFEEFTQWKEKKRESQNPKNNLPFHSKNETSFEDLSDDLESVKDFSLKKPDIYLEEVGSHEAYKRKLLDFLSQAPTSLNKDRNSQETKSSRKDPFQDSSLSPTDFQDLNEGLEYLMKKSLPFDYSFPQTSPTQESKPSLEEKGDLQKDLTAQEMADLLQGLEHLTGSALHPFVFPNKKPEKKEEKEVNLNASLKRQDLEVPSHLAKKVSLAPPDLPKKPDVSGPLKREEPEKLVEKKNKKSPLKELIHSLSLKKLQDLLFEEMILNPDFRIRVELQFLKDVPEDLLAFYLSQFDGLVYRFYGSSKNPLSTDVVTEEIDLWLQEKIALLLKTNQANLAFSLFSYAVSTFKDLKLQFEKISLAKWLEPILDKSEHALETEIFSWIELEFEEFQALFSYTDLFKILENHFLEEQYNQSKFRILKAKFEHLLKKKGLSAKENLQEAMKLLSLFLERYPEFNTQDPTLKAEIEGQPYYWQMEMERAIAAKDYEQARLFGQKALYLLPHGSLEYSRQVRTLIWLLNLEGYHQQANQLLVSFVKNNRYITVEDLRNLEAILDEETFWTTVASLEAKIEPFILAQVYFDKKRYEELMTLIEKREDLLLASQYQDVLKTNFSSRLEALWEKQALRKVKNATRYDEVIEAFQHILSLPHQKQKAKDLAKMVQEKYSRKYGLLHQLEKLGLLE